MWGPPRPPRILKAHCSHQLTPTDYSAQERAAEDAYLGDLGPIFRATVGDTINVTFLNRIERALSVHPHGVFYTKANEGALYADGTSGAILMMLP